MKRLLLVAAVLTGAAAALFAQTLNDIDTTRGFGREVFKLYQRYEALRFSGYIQPQFQWSESKGAAGYAGGDFAPNVNNRFMLRRGRLRVDYANFNQARQPVVYFVFQFDGTERGVVIRDFWGRIFENKFQLFSFTTGMFARPFGYELLLSSSDRETPERGRMSQILMRTERDLGLMVTFEPRRPGHALHWLKWDVGLFNGQGLSGPGDFDSHKDLITRLALKPQKLSDNLTLGAAAQAFWGGIRENSNTLYQMHGGHFVADTAAENIGHIAPRHYFGADAQLKLGPLRRQTELRAEFIAGAQTATRGSSETPGTVPLDAQGQAAPLYERAFNGAYFYWLQRLGSVRHQVVVKYDWYDPNVSVSGAALDESFTRADVKFSTLGFGYVYYFNEHLKITGWFDWVRNERTRVPGLEGDLPDNVFTCRAQYRF